MPAQMKPTTRVAIALALALALALTVALIIAIQPIFTRERYENNEDVFWTYWEPVKPPSVVRRCYSNWKSVGRLNKIIFLNPSNIRKYIPEDELRRIEMNSENSPAHKSDFIAFYILKEYGGTFLDGTVFFDRSIHATSQEKNKVWPPKGKFFAFKATRFSTPDCPCLETFFMHSAKGHPVATTWYNLLHEVGRNKEKFLKWVTQAYPDINKNMELDNYLWVYIVGKYMFLKHPELIKTIKTEPVEKGPYLEVHENGWNTDFPRVCNALMKRKKIPERRVLKLFRDLREYCDEKLIPL